MEDTVKKTSNVAEQLRILSEDVRTRKYDAQVLLQRYQDATFEKGRVLIEHCFCLAARPNPLNTLPDEVYDEKVMEWQERLNKSSKAMEEVEERLRKLADDLRITIDNI